MNKHELVLRMAQACDLSETAADLAAQAILDIIAQAMAEGERITLPNFGVFDTRECRLPQGFLKSGDRGSPADPFRVPVFKPATALRKKIKGSVPKNAS